MLLSQIVKSCKQKPCKISNVDKEYARQFSLEGVKFPVRKKDYAKIEKKIFP